MHCSIVPGGTHRPFGLARAVRWNRGRIMRARLNHTWQNLRSGLWFLPTVLVICGVAAAYVLGTIDRTLSLRASDIALGLFPGGADAAQTLIGVIAGSLVTAISIAFSTTIIALQQMAAQFTPRVLRTFTADRGNQLVLGTFIGTIMYSLLVMTQISTPPNGDPYIPALSINIAILLALICLSLLVYYIHHISQLLQVSVFMDR